MVIVATSNLCFYIAALVTIYVFNVVIAVSVMLSEEKKAEIRNAYSVL